MQFKRNKAAKIALCICFLILSLIFFQKQPRLPDSYIGKDVSLVLKAMPKHDREKLELFFLKCFHDDYFGYVLFGKKPMALSELTKKINPFLCLWNPEVEKANEKNTYKPKLREKFLYYCRIAFSPSRSKSIRAYETWKKYEKFFLMSQFTLLEENHCHFGITSIRIMLINNKVFIAKVQQHLDDFQKFLNHEIDGEKLLKEMINKSNLSKTFMNHDGLLGTVLGFGRNNAFLFQQKTQCNSYQEEIDFMKQHHLGSVWTDDEYENFSKQFDTGSHTLNLKSMALPGFIANSTSYETESLRKQYLETKNDILQHYKDKDFLETTLMLLTS